MPLLGARIALSCSAWMVATIECMVRSRARLSWAIRAPSPTIGRPSAPALSGSSRSSSTATTSRTCAPQHAAAQHALRVGGGGLVEHGGGRRPPVDQQRVAGLVAQADAADVARLLVVLGQVEAAEHETLVRGVQGGDALGGLEDHRVALDETALVAEVRPAVTLSGQLLGVLGGPLELLVDGVHELLLLRDLLLCHRVVGRRDPRVDLVNGQASAPGCVQNLGAAVGFALVRASGQLYPARHRRRPAIARAGSGAVRTAPVRRPRCRPSRPSWGSWAGG